MADAKIYKVGISLADKNGRIEDTIRTFDVALYNMYADDVRVLIDKFLDTSWVPSIEYGQVRIMHMYDVNYRKGSPWGVQEAIIKNGYKHISCFETPFSIVVVLLRKEIRLFLIPHLMISGIWLR